MPMWGGDVCKVKLRYEMNDFLNYGDNSSINEWESFLISGNNLNDPGLSLYTTKPWGNAQLWQRYLYCFCVASKITLRIWPLIDTTSTTPPPMLAWLLPHVGSSPLVSAVSTNELQAYPAIQIKNMPYGTSVSRPTVFKAYCPLKKIAPDHVTHIGMYEQQNNIAPSLTWAWEWGVRNNYVSGGNIPSNYSCYTQVSVTYYCRFHTKNLAFVQQV